MTLKCSKDLWDKTSVKNSLSEIDCGIKCICNI